MRFLVLVAAAAASSAVAAASLKIFLPQQMRAMLRAAATDVSRFASVISIRFNRLTIT